MWKKVAAAGGAAAVILGAGTAALAASGSGSAGPSASSPTATAQPTQGAHAAQGKRGLNRLRRAIHAQWVTKDGKTGNFVTHDAIRGTVSSASATSITVKAADNVSQTYVVNSSTKVHTRTDRKGTNTSMSNIHSGDKVLVVGTGTSTMTATQIVDGAK